MIKPGQFEHNQQPRILIVEDDPAIRDMLDFALSDSHIITFAETARIALDCLKNLPKATPFNLAVVDWMLPDLTGPKLIKRIRQNDKWSSLPIIMLTARSAEEDKIKGLNVGADDYMTKPFSIGELTARMSALIRRTQKVNDSVSIPPLQINLSSHQLLINNKEVKIGFTEFNLLTFFMTHPNRVYSRAQLLDQVWSENVFIEDRTVDVHILRLRKLLKPSKTDHFIHTVRGVGYRFSPEEA